MSIRGTYAAMTLIVLGTAAHAAGPLQGIQADDVAQADPAIVELGKLLFFDPRLSGDASTACSDCHNPSTGWSDAAELARGYPGTMHWRNSQTIVNMGFMTGGFHWDSGLNSLTDQVHDAMGAGFVANIDTILGEERLRQIPEYEDRFWAIWQEPPTQDRIAESIAAYERSIISADSPFDQYMAGQNWAMTDSAKRGLGLFSGKANCSACHSGSLATDQQFHNTSVPPNAGLAEDPLRQVTFRYLMRVKGLEPAVYEGLDRDPGRYLATQQPEDLGKFRTPPLRYLKYTAPYMHNGTFYTLEEVVDFYNAGGTPDAFGTKSPLIRPLGLTQREKADLVAFLNSMSGSEVLEDVPKLPEYGIRQFPHSAERVTVASLGGRAPQASPATASVAGSDVIAPSENTLTLVPKSNDAKKSVTPATQAQEQSQDGTDRFVLVEAGETLGTIARRIYGDGRQFQKLFQANRDLLRNPNDLTPGMVLRVPQ